MSKELEDRLREADRNSVQRTLGSRIFGEAADTLKRYREALEEIACFDSFVDFLSHYQIIARQALENSHDAT